MVIQGIDDGVVTECELSALVSVAGKVMPCVQRDRVLRSAGGTVVWEEGGVRT